MIYIRIGSVNVVVDHHVLNDKMEKITLYEEYMLIERKETDVNGVWKGAHLILFFLAFVFGSFCTFCFHMLMYLFDENCVLFPKLLSLTSLRQNIIYEFLPYDKEEVESLPVDFVNTQWVDKSTCYLPTYVPLVSGIFGLVWTTMFLMCSTGSRVLTGLQKPWRIQPPVFIFSMAMGSLCAYTSAVTYYGLKELCQKLGEITGDQTCSFTVNVATLAYERRIRGVYQAVNLTIVTAWLHTICWLLSALLAVLRIVLAVDFQLVKISARLKGNLDRILECQERQIGTVSPDSNLRGSSRTSIKTNVYHKSITPMSHQQNISQLNHDEGEILHMSVVKTPVSKLSLVDEERNRLMARNAVQKKYQFIVIWLYDLVDFITLPQSSANNTDEHISSFYDFKTVPKQYGQQLLVSKFDDKKSLQVREEINNEQQDKIFEGKKEKEPEEKDNKEILPKKESTSFDPSNNHELGEKKKSNLRQAAVGEKKTQIKKTQIDSRTNVFISKSDESLINNKNKKDKETQTSKEKQE